MARLPPTLPGPCAVSRPKPTLPSTSPARMRAGRTAGSGKRYVSARAAGLLFAPWDGSARSRSEAASQTDRANVGSVWSAGANLGCGMTRTRMSVAATTEAVRSPPRGSPSSPKRLPLARADFGRVGPALLPSPERPVEPTGRGRPLREKPNRKRHAGATALSTPGRGTSPIPASPVVEDSFGSTRDQGDATT